MRLLIVRLSAMGDVIHALPLAENAHRAGATVAWLAETSHAKILEGNPNVSRIFRALTKRWRRMPIALSTLSTLATLRRELREFRPDFTLDVQGLWKSAVLARLAGAPVVGFAAPDRREPSSALLVQRPVRLDPKLLHVVDQNLSLLAPLGIPVSRTAPEASYLLERRNIEAERFLGDVASPFVLYHPGAGQPEKALGEELYAELARRLEREHGFSPVISWGPGDEARLARMAELLPNARRPPLLDLPALAHVIAAASLFVGGDTGPLHLADALGVPTLALFGPTASRRNVPVRNGPYRGGSLNYAEASAVQTVVARAVEILQRRARPAP
ncbi:MAG: glycosyltransferase family 9 protein [Thermoanaerobaculia bacterium]